MKAAGTRTLRINSRGKIPIKGKGSMHTYWVARGALSPCMPDQGSLVRAGSRELLNEVAQEHLNEVFPPTLPMAYEHVYPLVPPVPGMYV